MRKLPILIAMCLCLYACNSENDGTKSTEAGFSKTTTDIQQFQLVPSSHSKLEFQNILIEKQERMWYNFNQVYNGAGVALGDINNDGLTDIFFTGNESENKLYLNKGDLEFEDITQSAEVTNNEGWHNGATMVDINGDGWLDIYICRGGWRVDSPDVRKNLLYINDKQGGFVEFADRFGLADDGHSYQSLFLDYDNDGDLDVYLVNHPVGQPHIEDYIAGRKNGSEYHKDKLYRNNGNTTFTDVTKEAGLYNTWGYGLSVTAADLDDNGYVDIYVANDYSEADYLFMNNGDGTFDEKIKEATGHISLFSMGTDIMDYNNDGKEDIFVSEMLPKGYKKSKTSMAPMSTSRFQRLVDEGFHYQYMHNSMQMNMGKGKFSEVSQMLGISKSDWSWSCFLSDMDNDGLRDLFVANGYKRDVYDRDSSDDRQAYIDNNNQSIPSMEEFLKLTPSSKSYNFFYKNINGYAFEEVSKKWGSTMPSFSNGASIGDLDNDGDLDIVTNNYDEAPFLYENKANTTGQKYLRIKLEGTKLNPSGIGAKITVKAGDQEWVEQFKVTRGFLASVEPIAHFGVGGHAKVDEVKVIWHDGKVTTQNNIETNQVISIKYTEAINQSAESESTPILAGLASGVLPKIKHKENNFDDFKKQILLPHSQSRLGPFLSRGDVNKDGLADIYVGGASGQSGELLIQKQDGSFSKKKVASFLGDKNHEDMGSCFFDFDSDGDMDLYVVSGGSEHPANDPYYGDRLYINDGKGNFKKDENSVPTIYSSGSCVRPCDYDRDGDVDLFVGGRTMPDLYPYPTVSYILKNKDNRFYIERNGQHLFPFVNGMVTDATWTDINGDNLMDLIIVGEWMPITVLINNGQTLINATEQMGLADSNGWWNTITARDLDKDGDQDYVLGNLGTNYKFKASKEKPFHVYANDFDWNGSYDIFLAKELGDIQVPIRGRDCSSQQMPNIKERFGSFKAFANADITALLGEKIDDAVHLQAKEFHSLILRNNGGSLAIEYLPHESQLSCVNAIEVDDFNNDGHLDVLVAGNNFDTESETTRADGSVGLLMTGQADGTFVSKPVEESGILLPYNVKDMISVRTTDSKVILVASNNDYLRAIKY